MDRLYPGTGKHRIDLSEQCTFVYSRTGEHWNVGASVPLVHSADSGQSYPPVRGVILNRLQVFHTHLWKTIGIGTAARTKEGFNRAFKVAFPEAGSQGELCDVFE